ncbi:MAG: hypothetical protein GY839_03920 [candidate division Zixibacteria bacterium]|nr:hypothetical protein [candidate division Zixibacteria bacterium]
MKSRLNVISLALIIVVASALSSWAGINLEDYAQDQKIHGFTVVSVYENGTGKAMGARFISDKYGFIIDLVQIQSVPQAFYWIKTPPTSSMGEPHACEHLLLGKGNRGRYVASLEDMALGNSSAYTSQVRTCYHFNTTAGVETFYELFEAKLQAFIHPDFTDEEISREVCNLGVVVDQQDGSLAIEEKGTVYTEMISSYEKPWYHYNKPLNAMVYGENHPLYYSSGGDPNVMRAMIPADMWKFHKETHHLSNMGAIVSIPDDISIDSFLKQMDKILNQCQDYADTSPHVGIGSIDFPAAVSAPPGTMEITSYPSENEADPGYIIYSWPADLKLTYEDEFILELFLDTFASGETSNLYNFFINSETRQVDFGGNYIYSGFDSDMDIAIYIGLVGIDNENINEAMVDSIRTLVINEIDRVRNFEGGSAELMEFNKRFKSQLEQNRKQVNHYLNSPPMFGFRSGAGGGWLSLFEELEGAAGFRKSLVMIKRNAYAESLLTLEHNIWKEYIDNWKLMGVKPYAVGAGPNPDYLVNEAKAKETRINGYVDDFMKKYNEDDPQKAIAKYKKDFDKNTAELDELAAKGELPGFIDNPPMTLDDQLKYETTKLPGDVPLVASTFDNMTSSEIGLAMRLDVVPESLLLYLPLLPGMMTEIGAIKDGQTIGYDEMVDRLRNEVLNLYAYFDHSPFTDRIELILIGSGNNLDELNNAIDWMDAALYSPYLSTDNLPRMLDIIDQSLMSYRNRMKRSEEGWVDSPADGYRYQDNPLHLTTACFLTEAHHCQRVKWMLTDPGDENQQAEIAGFLNKLAAYGKSNNRDHLIEVLSEFENAEQSSDNALEIVKLLKTTLVDIPDANLADDWQYLCQQIKTDIMVDPAGAIAGFNAVLDLIRKSDNARMFMISNNTDRTATLEKISKFADKLDSEHPSIRQKYASTNRIIQRLQDRHPDVDNPVYVGLVHDGTRNGVLIYTAEKAGVYDTSTSAILDCLAGKLYSGGGPHGLFMKTWAAGLAYSNGYRYNQATGRVRYYAERCPDVSETMRFVVGQLKEAKDDPALTDYAVAQVFGYSRAPSRYEQRGRAMASNLADGITPDKVRAFRSKVLAQRYRDGLYEELKSRMRTVYGPVMVGYGPSLSKSHDGNFFLIGPEAQFESFESHIEMTEGKQTIYRLYPRDFWLTM